MKEIGSKIFLKERRILVQVHYQEDPIKTIIKTKTQL